ncbi:MAG: hypothetical protein JKY88_14455 [Pseudomonadales bacterium]|nr:hypothetical protein [Pseudomonadales bacterium]
MVIREIEDKDIPALFSVRIATRENRMSLEELASRGVTIDTMRTVPKG